MRIARATGVALAAVFATAAAFAAAPARPDFAQADAPRRFVFPRDHGPHPLFRQEWWYVTGNLDTADPERPADPAHPAHPDRFGFELTFFRFALAPPPGAAVAVAGGGAPSSNSSAWRTRQIWMAHFAVTDAVRQRFRFAQKLSREALGLAGAGDAPPHVWVDDWSLLDAARDAAGTPPAWTLKANAAGYALDLVLTPQTAPIANGDQGLSRKAADPGAASYYYSLPRLAVRGLLTRAGRTLPVQGLAWMDREWGSGALGTAESGWDWFGLQLDDGTALMFYALRDRDGRRDPFSAGTWVDSSGAPHPLSSREVRIDVTAHWSSTAGDRYPAAWRVRIPSLELDLGVHPVLAAQELTGTPRYWEGAVDVHGRRRERTIGGRGYVELVGYAQERSGEGDTGAPVPLVR